MDLYIFNFDYSNNDYIMLDYVNVFEGSIKDYLDDNFESYAANKSEIDAFLNKSIESLDEIPFEVIS